MNVLYFVTKHAFFGNLSELFGLDFEFFAQLDHAIAIFSFLLLRQNEFHIVVPEIFPVHLFLIYRFLLTYCKYLCHFLL